jgi:hypothetical protein
MTVHDELEKQRLAAEAKRQGRQEWEIDAANAVPAGFMRDVLNDSRRMSQSASMIRDRMRAKETPRPPSGGGTVPITQPDGLKYIDQMCQAQDRLDRANAARVLLRADLVEAAMELAKGARIQSDYDPFERGRLRDD